MKKLLFTLLAVGYAWVLPAQEGLFGMERKGETIHWSIPDSLLGRDLMLTTTVLKAPARTTPDYTKKYGHPGDLFGPIILRFRKVDGEMWVTDPLYDRHLPATSDDPIVNIARLRGDERLYDTLPIVSESDGQTTIDVSRWLKSNQLLGLKPVAFELELGTEDASRTQLKDVKALPHCMLIRKRLTYRPLPFMTPGRKASTSESEWEVGICLSLLPKHPMPVRPSGMPYFGITQQEYQTNPLRASSRSLMKRWRLELTPEDSVRYFQGELVEPIHPIVVYVDRHTPARWLPCIMASVDAWQEAFEQAGFKNAIRAVKEPTDDPNFYNYDNSHAYISWKPSGQSNAYGPTPCLASTGEVKACHIGIFSSVPDLLQLWYFTQCGATDPKAWDVELPQSVMDELMKLVFTHEIGHSLGLEHNFFGSSLHSLDELRDNDFLSRHGMGSSIMDYMRCNYALRPGDRTDLRNRIARIGEYDRWAIEYGYRIFPGKTEEEQERNRQAWLKQTAGELQHRFLGSNDVRAQSEDLGDDHVAFNIEGNANILSDHFNSKNAGNPDWQFNVMAGLTFRFGKTYKKVEPVLPPAPAPAPKPEPQPAPEPKPEPKPEPVVKKVEPMTQNIFFLINQSKIRTGEQAKIDQLVAYLKQNTKAKVTLTGYADAATGSKAYNARLSRLRAEAVSKALQQAGISADRITVDYKGDTVQPFEKVADNRVTICVAAE